MYVPLLAPADAPPYSHHVHHHGTAKTDGRADVHLGTQVPSYNYVMEFGDGPPQQGNCLDQGRMMFEA